MPAVPYFGSYGRFKATERTMGAVLASADTIVGDELSLVVVQEHGGSEIWLDNRFGGRCGKLDAQTAHEVQLCLARGWDVHVLLVAVYQVRGQDASQYWGEVAICAYPASKAAVLDVFVGKVAEKLKEGVRVELNLQDESLEQIERADGDWLPVGRHALPEQEGTALIKDRVSLNEQMVEAARRRNPGCMVVGWAFIALLVVGVAWLIARLLGFV